MVHMASLIKRSNSPFWHLKYKSDGKWKRVSTGLRHNDPRETSQARKLRAKYEAKEIDDQYLQASAGWDWVEEFLIDYCQNSHTRTRYVACWEAVRFFLDEQKIRPEKLEYIHAEQYIKWRTGRHGFGHKNKMKPGRNTAILDLKIFSIALNEAVRRKYIPANPFFGIRHKRAQSPVKEEFTDDEITRCLEALKEKPCWMRRCFMIGLHTGCRLNETRIPVSCIDFDRDPPTMTWPSPKGGESKSFSIPIPFDLEPTLREILKSGDTHTVEFPPCPSRRLAHFFRMLGIKKTFHSLRVTRITRLRREGVPREVAMRLVNHSSELIHLLYDRHQTKDLEAYRGSGKVPTVDDAKE